MNQSDPRSHLAALVADRGESLAALSRLLGRNDAYLQQFVTRGSPRELAERDRKVLAAYLGVTEQALGAAPDAGAAPPFVRIPRLDAVASAGPGSLLDDDRAAGGEAIDPALLRLWGVRAQSLSIITARGESMLPTIADGDEMLVDRADTRLTAKGGIYIIRLEGALAVKRLVARGASLSVISDNPAYPPIALPIAEAASEIIGRVIRLTRLLR